MGNTIKIFIGFDDREKLNYDICAFSIAKHTTIPLDIIPIKQKPLRKMGLYTRPKDEKAATQFSLTRFLTPYLSSYKGWSLFMDCDMIITRDFKEVLDYIDKDYAVRVVKHDYKPRQQVKMDGMKQYIYPRKNWSSVILWNNEHPANKQLTPELVSSEKTTPTWLHRFQWLDDKDIGALPIEYNFLVGDYDKPPYLPFNIHHTNGSPFFPGYENVDFAEVWYQYRDDLKENKHEVYDNSPVSFMHFNDVINSAMATSNTKKKGKGDCGC